jgi:hypothetical protein
VPPSRLLQATALALSPFAALTAQQGVVRAPSGRPVVVCAGQRVDDLIIYADAPALRSLDRVPAVARAARALHRTTRPDVIRRFLLLDRGEPCSELRRAESERILRAQPFIAEARVLVVANGEGGVDVEVQTSDETALVLGGIVRARSPYVTALLLGNANLAGQGLYASGWWRNGGGFRDGLGTRLIDHQFLGRPLTMGLEAERATLGASWRVSSARPYFTDLQRLAWRAQVGSGTGFTILREPDGRRPGVAFRRSSFDVGAVWRHGEPGRLNMLGLSLTGLVEGAGDRLVLTDSGRLRDIGPTLTAYPSHRVARVNALVGRRDITYVRLEGLDALTASQDLPVGFQFGLQAGRSVPVSGAHEHDIFVASDLYVGATNGVSTVRLQLQGEARRGTMRRRWDDVLASGRLTHYLTLTPRLQNQTTLEFSAGFRQRMPFQLLLGIPEGGVRGYEESSFAGSVRVIGRTEQRYAIPNFLGASDAGVAMFADVGKQAAGDVPFGVTSPVVASLGLSLMAAVPQHSARLWRMDLAVPVTPGAGARWTVRFTNGDRTAFVFRTPRDVEMARETTVPSSIFAWP